jgi:hypothetical protein
LLNPGAEGIDEGRRAGKLGDPPAGNLVGEVGGEPAAVGDRLGDDLARSGGAAGGGDDQILHRDVHPTGKDRRSVDRSRRGDHTVAGEIGKPELPRRRRQVRPDRLELQAPLDEGRRGVTEIDRALEAQVFPRKGDRCRPPRQVGVGGDVPNLKGDAAVGGRSGDDGLLDEQARIGDPRKGDVNAAATGTLRAFGYVLLECPGVSR